MAKAIARWWLQRGMTEINEVEYEWCEVGSCRGKNTRGDVLGAMHAFWDALLPSKYTGPVIISLLIHAEIEAA